MQKKTSRWLCIIVLLALTACTGTPQTQETENPPPAETGKDESPPSPEYAEEGTWTAGIVKQKTPRRTPAIQKDIRTGRHEGFDRIVFEFQEYLPGYVMEYIDSPVRACGSGNTVELPGDGWLQVRFFPARAHTFAGEATIENREIGLAYPVLREAELTCDFEANLTWVLGVAEPNRYRVMTLADPPRIIVDIQH